MKQIILLLYLLTVTNIIWCQSVTIDTDYDATTGGSVTVQITDSTGDVVSNDKLCFTWIAPDGSIINKPEPTNLTFGTYCVKIVDCNFVFPNCSEDTEDPLPQSYFGCVTITGATCDGFEDDMSYSPEGLLCSNDASLLVISGTTPECLGIDIVYDWYLDGKKMVLDGNLFALDNVEPGQYCVHTYSNSTNVSCPDCEGYFL